MLEFFLVLALILTGLGAFAWAINYFVYGWVANVHPINYRYKCIDNKKTKDGSSNVLQENYDLRELRGKLESDSNYILEVDRPGVTNEQITVSRLFGDVRYFITISKFKMDDGNGMAVGFRNKQTGPYGLEGEIPDTPNYKIRRNIYSMIRSMPLNPKQKTELIKKVTVRVISDVDIIF